ncbi:suppressor of fused domain protein [Anaerotruncus colihominis]|uniref:suppressor of fused domain protein n=1 Tax=Anaerotruncus colihominis TaxID=169435 RepID=UPI0018980739|nr:suppressor of fused domain protein [Anaerotruncus colihominis]
MALFNKSANEKRRRAGRRVDPETYTADGTPVYRYEDARETGWRPPAPTLYCEEIEAHMDRAFSGRQVHVLHELMSDFIHIDLHVMEPDAAGGYFVLYTTGMSDLPMSVPCEVQGRKKLERAELMMLLPGDWDMQALGGDTQEACWPARLLKFLARFPHGYDTWFGAGHTIPNTADYLPYAENTALSGTLLIDQPALAGPLETRDGVRINLYTALPLYREEMEYKLDYGLDALMERMERFKPFILDVARENVCADSAPEGV